MLPIKFRGKEFKTGNIVYGINITHGNFCEGKEKIIWIGDEENGYHTVEEDSIVLLVGYDKDGREIYDGDALQTEENGTIYAATCHHAKIAPCENISFSEMAKRGGWTLKEAKKNENDG